MQEKNSKQKKLLPFLKDKSTIERELFKNRLNEKKLLSSIESALSQKKGSPFVIPKRGQPVIALMSGGIDTTVVIGMLIEFFGLRVYPLIIDRQLPHSRKIKAVCKDLSDYFKNKYPTHFHQPFTISQKMPHQKFSLLYRFENTILFDQQREGIPLQPALYAYLAVQYGKYLRATQNVYPQTIFGGWLPENSEWYRYESLSSLRSTMLQIATMEHDFSWQFTSLAIEKELGLYLSKAQLVAIGHTLGIPLEKTWTCYKGKRHQCGTCPPCWTRQQAFKLAGVVDETIYKEGFNLKNKFNDGREFLRDVKRNFIKK